MGWEVNVQARERLANERGAIVKDWGGRLPVALVYPNRYYVGMSSLGFQAVYRLLNSYQDVVCERAFVEAGQAEILSVESQRPLDDFAAIAFSVSFEPDYFNIVAALESAGVPVLAADRDDKQPLVIAGGPCLTANPEPLAAICDALVIGEAEAVVPALLETLHDGVGGERGDLLAALARIPGVYVPKLYDVEYEDDGTVARIESSAQLPVVRQWTPDLDRFPTSSVVLTDDTEFGDAYLIEAARGCGRGCRFCLAGFCFLPKRERSLDVLLNEARMGLLQRRRIGLVGAAVSDYSQIDELALGIRAMGGQLTVSSLRVDSLTPVLLTALAESGTKTLTIAPEAGSPRMRALINKNVDEAAILKAARDAARLGICQLKLYYMVGLPGETEDDVREMVELTLAAKREMERERPGVRLSVALTPFVPKAQTPLQWAPMMRVPEVNDRLAIATKGLRRYGIEVRSESPRSSALEGVLARGDRRLGPVLAETKGSPSAWARAMERHGLSPDFYLYREREFSEVLPWGTVTSGVGSRTLLAECRRAESLLSTPPCPPEGCRRCGVCDAREDTAEVCGAGARKAG